MDQKLWGKVPLGRQLATQGTKLVEQLTSLTETHHLLKTHFFMKPVNHKLIFIQHVTITTIKKMFCIETWVLFTYIKQVKSFQQFHYGLINN